MTRKGIAPYDRIVRDFRQLDASEMLRTTWEVERLIHMQSVQGHAHEGHCMFYGVKYPNTTMDDISRALRLDPQGIREDRQRLIDDIEWYIDRVLAGEESPPLHNEYGEPLLSSASLRDLELPGREVLRGLYAGGLRDDSEIRFETEARYDITIGGGKCYLVNTRVMDSMDLNGDILAHGAHEDMIDYYREVGMIVGEEGPDGPNVEYMYIRHRRGRGASDDTAILCAGMLWGPGATVGAFLADAVDTLEKHVPVFGDQDGRLARKIEQGMKDLGISDADVRHLTYLSAVPEIARIDVPDSSLRCVLLIDRQHDITAVESHLLFVQGRRYPPCRIGHEEVPNKDFYEYAAERLRRSPGAV